MDHTTEVRPDATTTGRRCPTMPICLGGSGDRPPRRRDLTASWRVWGRYCLHARPSRRWFGQFGFDRGGGSQRACEAAQVPCRYEPFGGGDPMAFVVSANLRRRHLNESQRAMVSGRWANMPAHRPVTDKTKICRVSRNQCPCRRLMQRTC